MSDSNLWNWDDENGKSQPVRSTRVTDIAFRLDCRCLTVDHTRELHAAIIETLPWFPDEPLAGLHLIYVAGSQNGWMRPEEPDEILHLSRRTRLTLRLPFDRVTDARVLCGQQLMIGQHEMKIGEAAEKPLLPASVLFSRHIISDETSETDFLQRMADEMRSKEIGFKKLLPGRLLNLRGPGGIIRTRSLMVGDLEPDDSIRLQESGLGTGRHYGCGLFIQHKGIRSARPE